MATVLDVKSIEKLLKEFREQQHVAVAHLCTDDIIQKEYQKIATFLILIYNRSYSFFFDTVHNANSILCKDEKKLEQQISLYFNVNMKPRLCGHLGVSNITLIKEHVCVLQEGGTYSPSKLESNVLGRLFVLLPSQYTGGEFLIFQTRDCYSSSSALDLAQHCTKCNLLAVFGNQSFRGTNPVTSGTQVFISFLITLATDYSYLVGPSPLCELFLDGSPSFTGFIDITVQQHYTRCLAREIMNLPLSAIGFILSEDYDESKVPIGMLQTTSFLHGDDRVLVEELKKEGCLVTIQPVLLCETKNSRTTLVSFLTDPNSEPSHFCSYPFFHTKSVTYANRPFQQNLMLYSDTILDKGFAIRLAVIVELHRWFRQRLLLLAKMKNRTAWCPLGCLPKEVLLLIWKMVCAMEIEERSEVSRKRKREDVKPPLQTLLSNCIHDCGCSPCSSAYPPTECKQRNKVNH